MPLNQAASPLMATKMPHLSSPSMALDKLLRGLRVGLFAKETYATLPQLRPLTEAFVAHLGPQIQFPGMVPSTAEPLVSACLRHAFEATQEALDAGVTAGDRLFVAYLKGLLRNAPEVMAIEAISQQESWNPLGAEPYSVWARKHPPIAFRTRDLDERLEEPSRSEIRSALLSRIVPPDLLVKMGRLIPEIIAND